MDVFINQIERRISEIPNSGVELLTISQFLSQASTNELEELFSSERSAFGYSLGWHKAYKHCSGDGKLNIGFLEYNKLSIEEQSNYSLFFLKGNQLESLRRYSESYPSAIIGVLRLEGKIIGGRISGFGGSCGSNINYIKSRFTNTLLDILSKNGIDYDKPEVAYTRGLRVYNDDNRYSEIKGLGSLLINSVDKKLKKEGYKVIFGRTIVQGGPFKSLQKNGYEPIHYYKDKDDGLYKVLYSKNLR